MYIYIYNTCIARFPEQLHRKFHSLVCWRNSEPVGCTRPLCTYGAIPVLATATKGSDSRRLQFAFEQMLQPSTKFRSPAGTTFKGGLQHPVWQHTLIAHIDSIPGNWRHAVQWRRCVALWQSLPPISHLARVVWCCLTAMSIQSLRMVDVLSPKLSSQQ